jgi:uncharacterized RDD family membrane protein YckC
MTHTPRVGSPGIARRLAAMAYETLLLIGVVSVTLILPHLLLGAFAHRVATPPLLWAHLFLVLLVYCVGFWSFGRQTLAMKTWRLRLLTRCGAPLRPGQALLRYLLCWPSLCLCGVGIAWALLDRDHQFLHDRLAGTRLVYAN